MDAIQAEQLALPSDREINSPVLRTLLICDLTESTAIVEKLGDQRAAELMRQHDRLSRDLLQRNGGREIDKTDGFLLLFERPIRAVAFALEYQRQVRDLGAAQSIVLRARVGIHVGEIVLWKNDVADIANGAKSVEAEGLVKALAARLMSIAGPCQILLSSTAYSLALRACSELGDAYTLRWRAHGSYRFRGVPEPVQVYEVGEVGVALFKSPVWSGKASRNIPWWRRPAALPFEALAVLLVIAGPIYLSHRNHPMAILPDHAEIASAAQEQSIAVLPFVDMSQEKDQEYFSDGLSEELIDHLVHVTDLKVIARTSSFQFKGRNEDVRAIGRELAVTHLLEGSVRKEGQQLRITAQLIRASDGAYLWSHTYSHPIVEIFKVQDEIAEQVSQALRAALPVGYRPGSEQPDIRAYNLVLEGNYLKSRENMADAERAAELYQEAINISPNYALAWACLASAFLNEEFLSGRPSEDQNRRILDTLDQALRLDPNLAWAYYTRGGFEMSVTWNWANAQRDVDRMREIDPRFVLLPRALGDVAFTFGELDRAVKFYQDDLERNPLDPSTLDRVGTALCAANRLQQCLEARLRLLQLHPEFRGVNRALGLARLYLGQFDEALAAMRRETNENYRLAGVAMVYSGMGKRAESDVALNTLIDKFTASDAYAIAEVYAYRREGAEALRWLDRAYQDHNFEMYGLKADPLLRNLHADPGFEALLDRMKLGGGKRSEGSDVHT